MTSAQEFRRGFRDNVPFMGGAFAFGMLAGSVSMSAGLDLLQAIVFSLVMYAGNAQIVALQLWGEGAPALLSILAIALVNARHVMYGASLSPHVRDLPLWQRICIGAAMVDNNFALASKRFPEIGKEAATPEDARRRRWAYYLGAVCASWPVWNLCCLLGIFVGASVPESWQLGLIPSLSLISMVVINLRDRPAVIAAVVAAILATLTQPLPLRLGLVVSGVIAMAAGLFSENARNERRGAGAA